MMEVKVANRARKFPLPGSPEFDNLGLEFDWSEIESEGNGDNRETD